MSVRKRRWTTRSGVEKEAWQVDYVDAGGKRRSKSFSRKKDADAWHDRTRVDVRAGVHVADSASVTVAEAGELWIKAGIAAGLERTTMDGRRQHLRLHIIPHLGARKLSQLTAATVRAFQAAMREGDPTAPDGDPRRVPRSEETIRRATKSLGALLADALEQQLVARNVVRDLGTRRRGTASKRHKARLEYGRDIPTFEEVRRIVAAAEASRFARWRPLLLVAIFTGLRASELRGLRWSDVDLEKARLQVRQRADRYHAVGAPKSAAGQRAVPLTPLVVNTLKDWRSRCPKGPFDLVFPNTLGRVESHPNIIRRGWHPVQVAAGVVPGDDAAAARYGGLHALRHWFASWCINRRVDGGLELSPKQVQARLGHSSISMTLDTYSHLFPEADEAETMAAAERTLLAVPAPAGKAVGGGAE